MQPLSGIRVVDLTNLLPGPLATLMLAEAGAEVIKIERPGGDDMRGYPPEWQGTGAAFSLLNRGKKLLTLDLKTPDGATQLRALLQDADILVEQFRPGITEKLGFGYDAARAINPRLIYCSITGYGQTGPRATEAGHDLNYIGNTGLLSLQPGPPDRPVVPPALIADIAGRFEPALLIFGQRLTQTAFDLLEDFLTLAQQHLLQRFPPSLPRFTLFRGFLRLGSKR